MKIMLHELSGPLVKVPTEITNAAEVARKKSPDDRGKQALMLGALIGKSLDDAKKYQSLSISVQRQTQSIRNVSSTIAIAKLTRASNLASIGSKIAIHLLVANKQGESVLAKQSSVHDASDESPLDDRSSELTEAHPASLSDDEVTQIASSIGRLAQAADKNATDIPAFSTALQKVLYDGADAVNRVIEDYFKSPLDEL